MEKFWLKLLQRNAVDYGAVGQNYFNIKQFGAKQC